MTRMTWVYLVAYGYMLAILLYRVIGRIRMMTLHLGVLIRGIDMIDRAWGHVCDMTARIRCPGVSGGDICAQLCIYAFRYIGIVVYDVGGYHMDVVINPGEVD